MPTTPRIITYRDAIENLNRYIGGNALGAGQEDLRQAIQHAYLELIQSKQWHYLTAIERIQFHGVVSTGTIEFDYEGGASPRLVTLTGSTWPTWAAFGELWIDSNNYRIDEVLSTTTATLEEGFSPSADIAAGTEYQLVQRQYPLPPWFMAGDELLFADQVVTPSYCTPAELMAISQFSYSLGTPTHYAILGIPELLGQFALMVYPPPDADMTADTVIHRRGSDLKLDGYQTRLSQGKITTVAGSATVNGTGTAFTSDMRGSVLRISATAAPPTGPFGMNPYVIQRTIKTVNSTSQIVLDDVVSDSLANAAYLIADPVDISPDMVNAFFRGCELQLCYTRDPKRVPIAAKAYETALTMAKAADNVNTQQEYIGGTYYRRRINDLAPPGISQE